MSQSIRAHFDGKTIVPDEPVELSPNESIIIDIHRVRNEEVSSRKNPAEFTSEEQLEAMKKLLEVMKENPSIPMEETRRINNFYEERY